MRALTLVTMCPGPHPTPYRPRTYDHRVTRYARQERRELADLLSASGPDAPTLCTGWTTRDLAAHLVVRERRPDASAGQMIPPLAGHGEHVRMQLAAQPYEEVVRQVRTPPWWSPVSNRLTDEMFNGLEFFIHHEDVRRGRPGWKPRELSPSYEEALRKRVRSTARLSARKFPATIVVHSPGLATFEVGAGGERVEVSGAPGELLIFFTGRQRVADVEVSGPDGLAERLKGARLGL
jgi:uncharacterized protein (TIGR03085 family)